MGITKLAKLASAHATLTRLEQILSTRQLELEEITEAEQNLEDEWAAVLLLILTDLYWYPLRSGIDEAPTSERQLRAWLRDQYGSQFATAPLQQVMENYLERGANVGGRTALELLGIGGSFHLGNMQLLTALEERAADLSTLDSNISMIDTTVNDLVRAIPEARESDENTLFWLGAFIGARAGNRSTLAAANELSWSFAGMLSVTYVRNGVRMLTFQTRGDGRVCPICLPYQGTAFEVVEGEALDLQIPPHLLVPLHTGCRCFYTHTDDTEWQEPDSVWRGE